MILDGEQDETVGVLLKQRLVGLDLPSIDGSLGEFDGLLSGGLSGRRVDNGGRDGSVLLSRSFKVELLDRGIAHLEVLKRGSSLFKGLVSDCQLWRRVSSRRDVMATYLLGGSELRRHCEGYLIKDKRTALKRRMIKQAAS
jgi:hypothetical protein